MKKKLLYLIACVTTISVIGLVVSQFVLVNKAIKLRSEQFDEMVYAGLSRVVDRIFYFEKEKILSQHLHDSTPKAPDSTSSKTLVPKEVLEGIDSLLTEEFGCFTVQKDYVFAIIDSSSGKIVYGNPTADEFESISQSPHRISLNKIANSNYFLTVFFPHEKHLIIRRMSLWLVGLAGFFLLILVLSFLYIIFTVVRQKKISEMKNDFINNMTHEFKTPISTISVASEMLMKPVVSEQSNKTRKYANIIYDENLRLRNQVEQVLQISLIDKKELTVNLVKMNIHKIIENSVDIFNMIVKEKDGEITIDLQATQAEIFIDELHFINVVTNLLDNAIKYSQNNPQIKVSTFNKYQGICIRVEDNGRGISVADHKNIFKKFFRVHTGDIHDVKGFGLGLYYVKSVMDAHNGTISLVKSELYKGSIFELYFPFNYT
ncbi:MAG: HAMP domain-containing sensor histidine kinase [Bacteroidota bacterium]